MRKLRLAHLREEKGWTRARLGAKAGVHPARVGQMELLRLVPPAESVELLRLARALGLPAAEADTLLDEVDPDGDDAR